MPSFATGNAKSIYTRFMGPQFLVQSIRSKLARVFFSISHSSITRASSMGVFMGVCEPSRASRSRSFASRGNWSRAGASNSFVRSLPCKKPNYSETKSGRVDFEVEFIRGTRFLLRFYLEVSHVRKRGGAVA